MTLADFFKQCKDVEAKRTPGFVEIDAGNSVLVPLTDKSLSGVTKRQIGEFDLGRSGDAEFHAFSANHFGKLVRALEASFKEIKVIRECALQEDAQNTAFKAFDSLCKIERLLLEDLKT